MTDKNGDAGNQYNKEGLRFVYSHRVSCAHSRGEKSKIGLSISSSLYESRMKMHSGIQDANHSRRTKHSENIKCKLQRKKTHVRKSYDNNKTKTEKSNDEHKRERNNLSLCSRNWKKSDKKASSCKYVSKHEREKRAILSGKIVQKKAVLRLSKLRLKTAESRLVQREEG